MDSDYSAESFSDALFTYLWYTENLISGSTAAETVGDMSEFVSDAAKAVVVLSALTVPAFNENMEEYFKRHEMNRRSVFTFLTKYCFKNHAENDDIFAVVLNTCTFVYRLVIFCQHKGHVEYVQFASMCWTEIFEVELKEEFYAKGGWEEFKLYVAENRYIPKDGDTDQRAFTTFLEEINYLFPKLHVAEPGPHANCILTHEVLANLEASVQEGILPPELLASEFTHTMNYINSFGMCNSRHEPEEEEEEEEEENLNTKETNQNETGEKQSDDSDEELYYELMRVGLDSISKYSAAPPSEDCVVCKNSEADVDPGKDQVCPKHNPDSFYYVATIGKNVRKSEKK